MKPSFSTYVRAMALAVALLGLTSAPAMAQAIFTNGAGLGLGIQETGAMGVSGTLPAEAGAPASTHLVGLSFVANYGATPTWRDATTPGCLCEGFGVSANGVAGFDGNDNGSAGLTVLDLPGRSSAPTSYTTLVRAHWTRRPDGRSRLPPVGITESLRSHCDDHEQHRRDGRRCSV